ncbi:TRAP transporter large permease [Clostridium sp. AM58-1XD]|uniref:TRAP transporter large permease n=1 Tax=Clostridium sp. AM58-1XD TaxID=2292307 RepID=UPI000E5568FA|nr:TRAP transporter large permease [Clostridium sp. AM58-1XD]RGZ01815.1 TRAP transporter large permease [Clostridium sp. AM58-1XD]
MNLFVLVASFFILLFLGIPIAYALCMSSLLYMVVYSDVPLIIIAQQMLKGVDSFTLMAIPFFVIAGSLMQNGGIARRMVNFAKSCIGFIPGGLAVVTVVTSMIFAAMTGAGAATTAAVGGIMIPFMRDEGYDADYASAVQAVGGIFGPLIPPSVLMVLYGVASGESVGDMLLAGLLPGLFLGVIVIAVVLFQCVKKGYRGSGSFNIKEVGSSFIKAIWAMLAPVIILGGIYSGLFTPTEASAVACFYCLFIGIFVYREIKPKEVCNIVYDGVKSAASIMFIVGATQVFGWVITREGIPQMVAELFTSSISSPLVFLLAVCLILLVAGCFIDAVPALLIFAPIFCPTALAYGIDMIHFGVVMVVVLCIGLVTPPVGINLFVASSVGGEPIHKIIPHLPKLILAIMVGALFIVLIPAMSTFLPSLLK